MANIRRFKLKLEKNNLVTLNKAFKVDDCYMMVWPYANVLGISSDFAKKIDESTVLPKWFDFANINSQNFNNKLDDIVSRITYALSKYDK